MQFDLNYLDKACINNRCYIHIQIKNYGIQQLEAHCRKFPVFYIKATENNIIIDEQFQCHVEQLQPMPFEIYLKKFKPLCMSHIYQSGPHCFVSISHAISDGALIKQIVNSLDTDLQPINEYDLKSTFDVFKSELEKVDFVLKPENRINILSAEKSNIKSHPFVINLESTDFINEKMNLFASIAVQNFNHQPTQTIGVGNMVDLRQFSTSNGLFLNFISGFNLSLQNISDQQLISEVLHNLRLQQRELKIPDYLMYLKALSSQRWDYFSSSSTARIELSNIGRFCRDVDVRITADEAFDTLSISFFTVENVLKGVVQAGSQFGEVGAIGEMIAKMWTGGAKTVGELRVE